MTPLLKTFAIFCAFFGAKLASAETESVPIQRAVELGDVESEAQDGLNTLTQYSNTIQDSVCSLDNKAEIESGRTYTTHEQFNLFACQLTETQRKNLNIVIEQERTQLQTPFDLYKEKLSIIKESSEDPKKHGTLALEHVASVGFVGERQTNSLIIESLRQMGKQLGSHASSMIGGIPKISIGFAKFLTNVIKKSNPQGVEKLSNIQQQMFAYLHCFAILDQLSANLTTTKEKLRMINNEIIDPNNDRVTVHMISIASMKTLFASKTIALAAQGLKISITPFDVYKKNVCPISRLYDKDTKTIIIVFFLPVEKIAQTGISIDWIEIKRSLVEKEIPSILARTFFQVAHMFVVIVIAALVVPFYNRLRAKWRASKANWFSRNNPNNLELDDAKPK